MKKKIVFVAYGGGHFKALVPVLNLAHAHGHTVYVLALNTAQLDAQKMGVEYSTFQDVARSWSNSRWPAYGQHLAAEFDSHVISEAESIAYLGCSYADLVEREGEQAAEQKYASQGRAAFLPVSPLVAWMESLGPDLLVATSAPRAEQAAFCAAEKLGIPSVCVVDMFADREIEWVGQESFSTRICVNSEYTHRLFVARGVAPSRLVVTGNPAFDALNNPIHKDEGLQLRARKKIGADMVHVLWASQHVPNGAEINHQIEEYLVGFLDKNRSYALTIRLHPGENREIHVQHPRLFLESREVAPQVSVYSSDLLLTHFSTMGLETYLCGKSVVQIGLCMPEDFRVHVEQIGYSGIADTIDAIGPLLLAARASDQSAGGFPAIGTAAEAVWETCSTLLQP